jgi:hypothetical protein
MRRVRNDIADIIERFVDKTDDVYVWDDFISIPTSDPDMELARRECLQIRRDNPSSSSKEWANEAGISLMRGLVERLRRGDQETE